MVLSYPNAALLRFYSNISPNFLVPRQRLLDLINQINWTMLFESHLDLLPNSPVVRFKSAFRGVGVGLPAYEAREAIQAHITRSAYLHNLIKVACRGSQLDAQLALVQAHDLALTLAGLSSPPVFL
jgi:hypothetical protein